MKHSIKKTLSLFMALLMVLTIFSGQDIMVAKASTLNSGKMNSAGTVTWKLTSDGVLTITGTGKSDNYSNTAEVPWYPYMTQITKVQIDSASNGITSMAYWFDGAANLISINRFSDSLISMRQTFKDCANLKSVPSIPATVTSVRNGFYNCTSLSTFPELPKNIADYTGAFKNCKSLKFGYINLTEAAKEAKNMLKGCENIDAFVVFSHTVNLTKTETTGMFDDAGTAEGKEIDVFYTTKDKTKFGSTDVQKYVGSYDNVKFPGYYSQHYNDFKKQGGYAYSADNGYLYLKGASVDFSTALADFSFKSKAKAVKIGSGIKTIAENLFKDYSALSRVYSQSSLETIGKKAFYGCTKLTNFYNANAKSLKTVGESSFQNCSSLKSFYIPDTVTTIGDNAFKGTSDIFYIECKEKNSIAIDYANKNSLKCKYPKQIFVEYGSTIIEGATILEPGNFTKIQLLYNDGSSEDLSFDDISIDEFEIVPGDNTLVARYGEFETEFNVTGLEKQIKYINAEYDSNEEAIEDGEINPDALTVTVEYDNGTEGTLEYDSEGTKEAGFYYFDDYTLVYGEVNNVTIRTKISASSSQTITKTVTVPVRKKKLSGIWAKYIGSPIVEGMGVNPENIHVFALYDNNKQEEILFSGKYNESGSNINTDYKIIDKKVDYTSEYNISDIYKFSIVAYKIEKDTDNTITILCEGRNTTIAVPGIAKSVAGITAEYSGTVPEEGELDIRNLSVSIKYNNEDTEELSDFSNITIDNNYIIHVGDDNYVTIKYKNPDTLKEYSASVRVEGTEKVAQSIQNAAMVKNNIYEGESLEGQEINISVLYDNGKTYDYKIKYEGKDVAQSGVNTLKFTFEGLNGEVSFTPKEFIPVLKTTDDTDVPETLTIGNSVMIKVTCENESVIKDKVIGWKSSDENILTVSDTGRVTAKSNGTATITATVNGKSVSCTIKVIIPAAKVTLSKTKVSLIAGESVSLKSTMEPANSTDKIQWSSSNVDIAKVSSSGKITAVKAGTATITATAYSGKKATCTVTVIKEAASIKISRKTLNLAKGKSSKLKYTLPSNSGTKSVKWISSNKSIVKVDKNGKVTGVKAGTAYVIVETASGVSAKCKVTVKNLATKISLNKSKATIKLGKSITLKYSVPKNTVADGIKWSTSNKKVAYVNNGNVTGVGIGTANITVKMSNGKKAVCKITVK